MRTQKIRTPRLPLFGTVVRLIVALGCGGVLLMPAAFAQSPTPAPTQVAFPRGSFTNFSQLPSSRFRNDLEQLSPASQERARKWLAGIHFTSADLESLRVDVEGGVYVVCSFPASSAAAATDGPAIGEAAVPVNPFPVGLKFHSRPGSANVLFLNFAGETVTGTAWNALSNRTTFNAVAFSTDGDLTTYSDTEQTAIKRIWQRVAEDYAPFNIDVTTERPANFTTSTAHALITRNTDANNLPNPASSAGGVAYLNVFGQGDYAYYRPGWVYLQGDESFMAEAASHEIGHNMGLNHDSCSSCSSGYYGGHGGEDAVPTSWGPIMGTGYRRNVSQWSKGEYYQASNSEDDLATIQGKVGYRVDDTGATPVTARPLVVTGTTNIAATTPENDPANSNPANKGVIERNTDVDVFSFVTGSGTVNLTVSPWAVPGGYTRGGNLDILLELYNESGTRLLTNNPASETSASLQTNLMQGRYFLHVKNTGTGSPQSASPSGYTSYASLGQYFINGTIKAPVNYVGPPIAEATVSDVTAAGVAALQFTVVYGDDTGVNVSTLDSSDIRVTGPGGYDQLAQFLSIDVSSNGSPRTATYSIPPPNSVEWLFANNGTYTLTLRSNQVADVDGGFAAQAVLDQFEVGVPLVIYSANMSSNPGWTLDSGWAYGAPNYPGNSEGPPSGHTGPNIVGYNLSGNYENGLSQRNATTPLVDATGVSSLTLRFRRWLGLRSGDTAIIQVSTNGTTWLNVWSSSARIDDTSWAEVQYALPASVAGSPAVRLRWGLSSGPSQSDIGWNIDEVEIFGGGLVDTAPPAASLNISSVTEAGSAQQSCSVTYTDAGAVNRTTLDSFDLLVTGPGGYSNAVSFAGADSPTNNSTIVATYGIPAPGGEWGPSDNGTYFVTLQADEVADVLGNAAAEQILGSFSVAIPTNPPGMLMVESGSGLNATGLVGGPFTPGTALYELTNSGGQALSWSADAPATWLVLAPTNGQLGAGASLTVTALVSAAANALPVGSYSNVIYFTNLTSGLGSTQQQVSLTVNPVPTVNLSLSAFPTNWGTVSPTSGVYAQGTNLQLVATPVTYFKFVMWSGGVSGTNNPLNVTLYSNLTAQAQFDEVLTTNHPTPHWWLAQFGYTNDFETIVDGPGANGMALWQSCVAGLEPTNPASQLLLSASVLEDGSTIALHWNTVTGRVYSIWAGPQVGGVFAPLAGASNLPPTVNVFTNPVDQVQGEHYYRLEVRRL
jgi:hypothetical protein